MIKLTIIKTNPEWLEATWTEEIITTSLVENEVDGEILEETVDTTETTILHCESFSGNKEHIQMLRDKAKEFGTALAEFEDIIKEVSDAYVYPTEEEIAQQELKTKINEMEVFLNNTQFKFGDDYDLKDTPEWLELKAKRQEAREFIRANKDKVK